MTDAKIMLWGTQIAAVTWLPDRGRAVFQYSPDFIGSGIEVSPLMMPVHSGVFEFPDLPKATFRGLPGLLAESLPDKFGNAVIDAWLARDGQTPESFNPVQRLCYIGRRGMGALEFEPTVLGDARADQTVDVQSLVRLANDIVNERSELSGRLTGEDDQDAIQDILRVGTSAGGARAKAVLAWNEDTGEFRSGQLPTEPGFSQWLIKFDGVSNNGDKEMADPLGYGLIEYAYAQMATAAGIQMSRCRLHRENGRSHFMTLRFDRTTSGDKLHMQSLGSLMHYDFNQPAAYGYEQALQAMRRLGLSMQQREEQFRRAVFNVVARNQDDHVKNIAFLMNRQGRWQLSPAYDIVYAYNPSGVWTGQHQMSINGKRDQFEQADLIKLAKVAGIKKHKAISIGEQVTAAVTRWLEIADSTGVDPRQANQIHRTQRLDLF